MGRKPCLLFKTLKYFASSILQGIVIRWIFIGQPSKNKSCHWFMSEQKTRRWNQAFSQYFSGFRNREISLLIRPTVWPFFSVRKRSSDATRFRPWTWAGTPLEMRSLVPSAPMSHSRTCICGRSPCRTAPRLARRPRIKIGKASRWGRWEFRLFHPGSNITLVVQ